MPKLHILTGQKKGQTFDLKGEITYIGRSSENDIQVSDETVSRKHLKIQKKEDKYFIEDLKSYNGTFVDGRQIEAGVEFEMKGGLPVAMGKVLICLGKATSPGDKEALDDFDYITKNISEWESSFEEDRRVNIEKDLELISKVSNILMQSLNINEVLQKILDYIFELLKRIDKGAILLIDRKTGDISEVILGSEKGTDDSRILYSRTVVERVVREGKPVIISDSYSEDEVDLSESLELMKVRSVMCVPMICRSQIHGVIYVASSRIPNGFRKGDIALLVSLSSPAALAIDNAQFGGQSG